MTRIHIFHLCKRIFLYTCLLCAIAATSLAVYVNYKMNYDLTAVLQDRLYRSSEINPSRLADLATKHGISLVIDLRHPDLDDKKHPQGTTRRKIKESRQALLDSGVTHISIPSLQRPDDTMVDAFLEAIQDYSDQAILVHCDHGIGRAGVYAAIYLIEHAGYSNEDARRVVSRYYSPRLHGRKHFRAEYNKGKWIIDYKPKAKMIVND
jgi:protein-tyrosine phosphatase